jgi:hypothetical protein
MYQVRQTRFEYGMAISIKIQLLSSFPLGYARLEAKRYNDESIKDKNYQLSTKAQYRMRLKTLNLSI